MKRPRSAPDIVPAPNQLHADRLIEKRKRTYREDLNNLPDGAYVALDGKAWLLWGSSLFAWSDSGYDGRKPRGTLRDVEVLTPCSSVAILKAGYRPSIHPSAEFTENQIGNLGWFI
jgi:hypothetical protein